MRKKEVSGDEKQENYSIAMNMKRRLQSRGNIERKRQADGGDCFVTLFLQPSGDAPFMRLESGHISQEQVVGQLCGHENRTLLAFDGRMPIVSASL